MDVDFFLTMGIFFYRRYVTAGKSIILGNVLMLKKYVNNGNLPYNSNIIIIRFYKVLSRPRDVSKHFRHYYPWSLGLKSFLKTISAPWEYTCAIYALLG